MSKLIAIDNGHGIKTAGKRTPKMPDGKVTHEWEFNYPTAKKLDAALKRCGFRTLMVSDTSTDTPLQTRAKRANDEKADAFVSIHYNAFKSVWGDHGGLEVLYSQGSTNGKKLADLVLKELIPATGMRDRGLKPRNNIHVLRATKMPAILPECGFMDNLDEAKLMLDEGYQTKCAEAITRGVCTYFGVSYVSPNNTQKPNPAAPKPSSNIYYGIGSPHNTKSGVQKLQKDLIELGFSVGSYGANGVMGNDTKNAVLAFQKANKLKADGFAGQATLSKIKQLIDEKNKPKPTPKPPVASDNTSYDVQIGNFGNRTNAEKRAEEAKKAGFDVYIKPRQK